MCINRHHGGINMLFADWSVRKVGLKELWTLEVAQALRHSKRVDPGGRRAAGGLARVDARVQGLLTRRMAESRRTRMRVGWEKTMKRRTIFRCVPGGRGLRGGFTLIELLVVISIVALLMAVLLPTLPAGPRTQAKAVACQSNLHQWALILEAYAAANHRRLGGRSGPARSLVTSSRDVR